MRLGRANTSTINADKPRLYIAEIKHLVEQFGNAGMSGSDDLYYGGCTSRVFLFDDDDCT